MKVFLTNLNGYYNMSLRFEGYNPDLYKNIKDFIQYNNSYKDGEFHKEVKNSGVFIQCDADDCLMLEFWQNNYMPLVDVLCGEFGFGVEK